MERHWFGPLLSLGAEPIKALKAATRPRLGHKPARPWFVARAALTSTTRFSDASSVLNRPARSRSLTAKPSRSVVTTILGPLRRASAIDVGANVPELEGDFAGESMLVEVSGPDSPGILGTFAIWRDGFEFGRRFETPDGVRLTVQVAGMQIRVMPAPDLPAD